MYISASEMQTLTAIFPGVLAHIVREYITDAFAERFLTLGHDQLVEYVKYSPKAGEDFDAFEEIWQVHRVNAIPAIICYCPRPVPFLVRAFNYLSKLGSYWGAEGLYATIAQYSIYRGKNKRKLLEWTKTKIGALPVSCTFCLIDIITPGVFTGRKICNYINTLERHGFTYGYMDVLCATLRVPGKAADTVMRHMLETKRSLPSGESKFEPNMVMLILALSCDCARAEYLLSFGRPRESGPHRYLYGDGVYINPNRDWNECTAWLLSNGIEIGKLWISFCLRYSSDTENLLYLDKHWRDTWIEGKDRMPITISDLCGKDEKVWHAFTDARYYKFNRQRGEFGLREVISDIQLMRWLVTEKKFTIECFTSTFNIPDRFIEIYDLVVTSRGVRTPKGRDTYVDAMRMSFIQLALCGTSPEWRENIQYILDKASVDAIGAMSRGAKTKDCLIGLWAFCAIGGANVREKLEFVHTFCRRVGIVPLMEIDEPAVSLHPPAFCDKDLSLYQAVRDITYDDNQASLEVLRFMLDNYTVEPSSDFYVGCFAGTSKHQLEKLKLIKERLDPTWNFDDLCEILAEYPNKYYGEMLIWATDNGLKIPKKHRNWLASLSPVLAGYWNY